MNCILVKIVTPITHLNVTTSPLRHILLIMKKCILLKFSVFKIFKKLVVVESKKKFDYKSTVEVNTSQEIIRV